MGKIGELTCPYLNGSERCEGWHQGVEDTKKLFDSLFQPLKKITLESRRRKTR